MQGSGEVIEWDNIRNFSAKEFACSHCGEEGVRKELVQLLQIMRDIYGKPIYITSGYRCPEHPIEAAKNKPGAHAMGIAADIAVDREDAYVLLKIAFNLNFRGIGVSQKGEGRFLHVDMRGEFEDGLPSPALWSY